MMEELTHPVELTNEELDLVAAGGGGDGSALVNVEPTIVIADNNVAVGVGSIIKQS